jgi:hypothetical protein
LQRRVYRASLRLCLSKFLRKSRDLLFNFGRCRRLADLVQPVVQYGEFVFELHYRAARGLGLLCGFLQFAFEPSYILIAATLMLATAQDSDFTIAANRNKDDIRRALADENPDVRELAAKIVFFLRPAPPAEFPEGLLPLLSDQKKIHQDLRVGCDREDSTYRNHKPERRFKFFFMIKIQR